MTDKRYRNNAERARKLARHLCHRNIGMAIYNIPHTFSTDDLRERLPLEALAQITDNRFFGGLVSSRQSFIPVCEKKSRIPGQEGRRIKIFTIPEYLEVVEDYRKQNPASF